MLVSRLNAVHARFEFEFEGVGKPRQQFRQQLELERRALESHRANGKETAQKQLEA